MFRITITSFLDAYNFDVRRVMKCCIHHVLPSGHVIPFCAYNVLYRDGHVPLPALGREAMASRWRSVEEPRPMPLDAVASPGPTRRSWSLAVAVAAALGRRPQSPLGLTRWQRLGIGLGGFCGAMIGAKLPFVLADWEGLRQRHAPGSTTARRSCCGLVGGYFGVEVAKWALDIRVKTGDTFAVPVAAAVAIGRLACFVGGCCYGTPTDAAVGRRLRRRPAAAIRRSSTSSPSTLTLRGRPGLAAAAAACSAGSSSSSTSSPIWPIASSPSSSAPSRRLALGLTGYQWAAVALVPVFVLLSGAGCEESEGERGDV